MLIYVLSAIIFRDQWPASFQECSYHTQFMLDWVVRVAVQILSGMSILDFNSCFNFVRRLCSIFCVRRLKLAFFALHSRPQNTESVGSRSFVVSDAVIWNNLPSELPTLELSVVSFAQWLKAHLFNRYELQYAVHLYIFSNFSKIILCCTIKDFNTVITAHSEKACSYFAIVITTQWFALVAIAVVIVQELDLACPVFIKVPHKSLI